MRKRDINVDVVLIFTLKTRSRYIRKVILRGKENFLIES